MDAPSRPVKNESLFGSLGCNKTCTPKKAFSHPRIDAAGIQNLPFKYGIFSGANCSFFGDSPKDHWTLKTGYLEDPTLAIQVQTLLLEGPRSLGQY